MTNNQTSYQKILNLTDREPSTITQKQEYFNRIFQIDITSINRQLQYLNICRQRIGNIAKFQQQQIRKTLQVIHTLIYLYKDCHENKVQIHRQFSKQQQCNNRYQHTIKILQKDMEKINSQKYSNEFKNVQNTKNLNDKIYKLQNQKDQKQRELIKVPFLKMQFKKKLEEKDNQIKKLRFEIDKKLTKKQQQHKNQHKFQVFKEVHNNQQQFASNGLELMESQIKNIEDKCKYFQKQNQFYEYQLKRVLQCLLAILNNSQFYSSINVELKPITKPQLFMMNQKISENNFKELETHCQQFIAYLTNNKIENHPFLSNIQQLSNPQINKDQSSIYKLLLKSQNDFINQNITMKMYKKYNDFGSIDQLQKDIQQKYEQMDLKNRFFNIQNLKDNLIKQQQMLQQLKNNDNILSQEQRNVFYNP